jgi:hypothetical protein
MPPTSRSRGVSRSPGLQTPNSPRNTAASDESQEAGFDVRLNQVQTSRSIARRNFISQVYNIPDGLNPEVCDDAPSLFVIV